MAIALSPSVTVVEKDFTSIVPQISSSACAFAGQFNWGPILDPRTISSENDLVARYGKPNATNYVSFFTAANFLSYSSNLLLTRINTKGSANATVTQVTPVTAPNIVAGLTYKIVTIGDTDFTDIGASANAVGELFTATDVGVGTGTARQVFKVKNRDHYDSVFSNGGTGVGMFAAKWAGIKGNSIKVSLCDESTFSTWDYKLLFTGSPNTSSYAASKGNTTANDELHIVVIDENGLFTGQPGTILEKFSFVSKASDAQTEDGTNNYYRNVLNDRSEYVWWMDHPATVTNWGRDIASNLTMSFDDLPSGSVVSSLSYGEDDSDSDIGDYQDGYSLFSNEDLYPLAFIAAGKANPVLANFILGIAESRRDVVAFISPERISDGAVIGIDANTSETDLIAYRDELMSTSFGFLDSGYKYQYDRYNDRYWWIPLNGDIAGLAARTTDPWDSPAGYTKGQIKNVIKLAINPNRTQRDKIYPKGINPIVSFPGQGTVLFGDKTLLAKPSAFDRITTRRLFIYVEKSISESAKYQLFEFNDSFSRSQFKNRTEPFLVDVRSKRGINDFEVVCDSSNNPPSVVERNEFVADIKIKPNYSTNYITLNFVASRQGISFSTVG